MNQILFYHFLARLGGGKLVAVVKSDHNTRAGHCNQPSEGLRLIQGALQAFCRTHSGSCLPGHLHGRLFEVLAHPAPAAVNDGPDADFLAAWQANAVGALRTVIGWLDDPARLCIENVEAWDPDAFAPVLDVTPVSRTVDVGHLWLRGEDPLPRLASWIDRAQVVHLHGVAERDHKSLAHVPTAQLDPIVAFLAQHFTGVVTLEVFNQEDFLSSQAALAASLARVGGPHG